MKPDPRRTSIWDGEPTAIVALVTTLIALAVSFGLDLTQEQSGLIIAVVIILAGGVARQHSYSPRTVEEIVNEVADHPSSPDHPHLP